jgi:hypothetical protein
MASVIVLEPEFFYELFRKKQKRPINERLQCVITAMTD